jgi:hypothetical protein
MAEVVWPAVRHNLVAVRLEPYRQVVGTPGFALSTKRSDGTNGGLLLGLTGLVSLVPLLVLWAVGIAAWPRGRSVRTGPGG